MQSKEAPMPHENPNYPKPAYETHSYELEEGDVTLGRFLVVMVWSLLIMAVVLLSVCFGFKAAAEETEFQRIEREIEQHGLSHRVLQDGSILISGVRYVRG
jgi:hypothetical protein